jgi:hypothetical protein
MAVWMVKWTAADYIQSCCYSTNHRGIAILENLKFLEFQRLFVSINPSGRSVFPEGQYLVNAFSVQIHHFEYPAHARNALSTLGKCPDSANNRGQVL